MLSTFNHAVRDYPTMSYNAARVLVESEEPNKSPKTGAWPGSRAVEYQSLRQDVTRYALQEPRPHLGTQNAHNNSTATTSEKPSRAHQLGPSALDVELARSHVYSYPTSNPPPRAIYPSFPNASCSTLRPLPLPQRRPAYPHRIHRLTNRICKS